MKYYLGADGEMHVSFYKSRLKNWGDFGPRSEVTHRDFSGLEGYPGLYTHSDLTICGLSGGAVNPARAKGSLTWRVEE